LQPWRSFERIGAVSHDGRIVATLDPYAPDVMLWDADTGAKLSSLSTPLALPATGNYVCEFSPDRQTLAVGRNSLGLLELWDVPSRTVRQTFLGLGRGDRIESIRFASGSSRKLVSAVSNWDFASSLVWQGIDKLQRSVFEKPVRTIPTDVVVWDMSTARVRARLKGETWGIISADGSILATGGGSGAVTLWDITSK
jgi:WD40 repeat protein